MNTDVMTAAALIIFRSEATSLTDETLQTCVPEAFRTLRPLVESSSRIVDAVMVMAQKTNLNSFVADHSQTLTSIRFAQEQFNFAAREWEACGGISSANGKLLSVAQTLQVVRLLLQTTQEGLRLLQDALSELAGHSQGAPQVINAPADAPTPAFIA